MSQTQSLTGLQFRIQLPEGGPQQLLVDSEQVLIGSGAHCDIRLPSDQAAAEHVLITFLGGTVHAKARALEPPPMLNGSPFTEMALPANAVLQVGRSEITVSLVEITDKSKLSRKRSEPTSPLTYVLAAIAVPLALFVILDDPPDETVSSRPKDVPALWDSAAVTCPQRAQDQALNLAYNRKLTAEGKRERSPFDVRDGVAAVPLFQLAAACFQVAGEPSRAAEMQAAAERLKKKLEDDYRAHQIRLGHALDTNELQTAQREVRILLAMLQGKNDPYVVWLSNLERRLKLKLGKDAKS